ncbi:Hypothetical predicted protein [Mytilus galloprovincialis]|uniref:Mab-21-like nucleotidyltransferase domain-containing protein n=1 Tax=Mytilus galloprovincialis TaxID=29158 RepID=A0A8B6CA41_MYTGA|nr:Hypothetical predicted protein [Mytilus galloprovincialis]
MATDKSESLHLYKFLCQKIGSEQVVRLRRLTFTIVDIGNDLKSQLIYSGSKGEGLKTKGSDLDLMFIIRIIKVYESARDVPRIDRSYPLVMDTEGVSPCFTKLRLIFNDPNIYCKSIQNLVQIDSFGKYFFSNKLLKMPFLQANLKIHGPCVSDHNDVFDFALVLQCNQWISPAQPWITRSRGTWPSPDIISKITSCGVFFVPVGYKGSVNEEEEWRISFSIAEKFLIFSFNHTQLLCYALLKIVLKEIVEKQEDLKGVQSDAVSGWMKLASYFYVQKNYKTALLLTDYSLWKCTDEKIDSSVVYNLFREAKMYWNQNQEYVMKLTKHWKLYTVLKMLVLQGITFTIESPFIPPELQMEVAKFPVQFSCEFPPKQFAHFLRFLCYFHLHDLTSCTYALHQLEQTSLKCHKNGDGIFTMTFLGIAYQMIGETSLARQQFCLADQIRQELYSYMCN